MGAWAGISLSLCFKMAGVHLGVLVTAVGWLRLKLKLRQVLSGSLSQRELQVPVDYFIVSGRVGHLPE